MQISYAIEAITASPMTDCSVSEPVIVVVQSCVPTYPAALHIDKQLHQVHIAAPNARLHVGHPYC
jgi:hypothetical protein